MTHVIKDAIVRGLRKLGLGAGHKALVHSSLRSFGHVEGGADAVIDALLETVGPEGTVLVPTLTGDASNSAANPPVFDRQHTPCWTGRIPETFRQRPDAVRSLHPTHSVAAIGADATALTEDHVHSITPCDARSPYGKLAQQNDSYVLLIGVDHEVNTTLHGVEEIAGVAYHMQTDFAKATLYVDGQAVHKHYMLHQYGARRHFSVMEPIYVERGIQQSAHIGSALVRLVHLKAMFEVTLQCVRANHNILCAQ